MNQRYNSARQAFGEGRLNWVKDEIVGYLVDASYQFSALHIAVQDLKKGVLAGPEPMDKRAIAGGYATSSPAIFESVKGDPVALVIAKKNATLIAYIDEIEGFPVKVNGVDVVVKFRRDQAYWFRV